MRERSLGDAPTVELRAVGRALVGEVPAPLALLEDHVASRDRAVLEPQVAVLVAAEDTALLVQLQDASVGGDEAQLAHRLPYLRLKHLGSKSRPQAPIRL